MTDNQNYEDEDDYYDEGDLPVMSRWKMIGAGLAVVVVAGFGIGIWYAYDQGVKKGVQLAPPIIKADTSPVKVIPEDRGGMDIPHQDKKVFDVLKADTGEEKVEKLMEAPEEATQEPAPVDITETAKDIAESAGDKAGAETLMAKPDVMAKPSVAAKEMKETAEKAVKEAPEKTMKMVEEPAKAVAEVPAKKAEDVVAKAAPAPVKTPAGAVKYRVQLGAFRSTDAAEKAWIDFQKAHTELLGGIPHRVQSVEIKGKGMFHRLQAGAFADKADAIILCTNLKAEKQDCLVAKN